MRRETRIWLTVLGVSLSVHAGALAVFAPSEQMRSERMEGGSVSLADSLPSALVVQGIDVQSDPASETLEPIEPVEAAETPMQTPPVTEPQESAAAPVEQTAVQMATPVEPVEARPAVTVARIAAGEGVQATASDTAEAVVPEALTSSADDAARPAEAPQQIAPAPVQTTIAAITTVPLPRHNPRIDRSAPPPEPRASKARRGNADQDRSQASNSRAAKPSRKTGNDGRRQASAGRFNSANYAGRVMAHLRRHQRYPRAARSARLQGKAMVRFTIRANGSVSGVRLVRSSGHSLLDREALAMVRRAARFPPLPRTSGRNAMTITAPVNYRLR